MFILIITFLGTLGTLITIPVFFLIIFVFSVFFTSFFGSSWLPTSYKKIDAIINELKLKKGDTVYDLGSGDGRIVITIAKKTKANVVGIEIDAIKWLISCIRIKTAGLKNAKVIRKSFFNANISNADVVFCYLPARTLEKLGNKLKTLRKGTIIVSNGAKIRDIKLTKELKPHKIYIYRI